MFHLLSAAGILQTSDNPSRLAGMALVGLAVLVLAGCQSTQPVVIERPTVVTRVVYVPIDPALTAHGDMPEPRSDTGREVLRVAQARKAELSLCYGKLDAIGTVQGTEPAKAASPADGTSKP